MIKRLAIGIVVVTVVAAGVVLLRSRSTNGGRQVEESVRRAEVERGELVVSVTATGSIVPKTEAKLSFDRPGKVAELLVEVGDSVKFGDALARLDDANLTFALRQAQAALAAAQAQLDQLMAGPRREEVAVASANLDGTEAGLDGAIANLRELADGPNEAQIAAAEANLRAAEASLSLAEIQRDEIAAGATSAEIEAAKAQVASALLQQKIAQDTYDRTLGCYTITLADQTKQEICPGLGTIEEQARFNLSAADAAFEAAQAQLDQLLAGATGAQINSGDANVELVSAQRDAAQAQLDLLRSSASAEQLQAAEANVAAFTAQRDAAQAQLDLVMAGADAFQISATRANAEQARIGLEMAQAELDSATLVVPFDSVVTAVNVQAGQIAPTTVPAVTVADMSQLQIKVDVDEIDVARIAEGQEVKISVDAFPGIVISGRVSSIAPAASQVGGVVVYQVTVVLEESNLPLRAGMSATTAITVEQMDNVLLVPNWAIRIDRDTGQTFVNLLRTSSVDEVEVEIGVRSEDVSEVLAGLDEGDVVAAGDVIGLRSLLDGRD